MIICHKNIKIFWNTKKRIAKKAIMYQYQQHHTQRKTGSRTHKGVMDPAAADKKR
jgi:hypothetical protein